jgi:VanZ family protein
VHERLSRLALDPPDRFTYRYLPAIVWGATIFVLSSIPGDTYPDVDVPFADKWVHLVLYAPFGWLLARAVSAGEKRSPARGAFVAVAIGLLFAASDELHQLWVTNRTCSLADWIVDSVGVALGVGVWVFHRSRRGPAAAVRD